MIGKKIGGVIDIVFILGFPWLFLCCCLSSHYFRFQSSLFANHSSQGRSLSPVYRLCRVFWTPFLFLYQFYCCLLQVIFFLQGPFSQPATSSFLPFFWGLLFHYLMGFPYTWFWFLAFLHLACKVSSVCRPFNFFPANWCLAFWCWIYISEQYFTLASG